MVAVVEELRITHAGQRVVVVSHSDPIRLLLAFYSGLHMDMFQRLALDPASISEIEFGPPRPRLIRSNDCAHLRVYENEEK
jgi:probable phosphoglycerate mutase